MTPLRIPRSPSLSCCSPHPTNCSPHTPLAHPGVHLRWDGCADVPKAAVVPWRAAPVPQPGCWPVDNTEPMSGLQCALKGTQQGIREMSAGTRRIRNVGRDATVEGGVGRKCNSRAPGWLVAAELPSLHPRGTGTTTSFSWLFPFFGCTQQRAQ